MKTYKIAPFVVDITPPIGHTIAYGINEKIDSNIYVRGVVIDDSKTRVVIAAGDVLYFTFSAYDKIVAALADAAGTLPENVFLTAVHQHDSVEMKFPGEDDFMSTRKIRPEYWEKCLHDIASEVGEAVSGNFSTVEHIATASVKIRGLASNRRTYNEDGSIAMRYSMCEDLEIRSRPEGVYDPFLRTIAFLDKDESVITALHYYACHPMAAYHRNMVSADVPGVALRHVADKLGVNDRNIYITGCGGNVTFSKYGFWDGSEENKIKSRDFFGEILGEAMVENLSRLEKHPCGPIEVRSESLELPLQEGVTAASLHKIVEDTANSFMRSWEVVVDNWDKYGTQEVRTLSFGDEVVLLELFAEMAVEYQLYAHSLVQDRFLAVSAYNEPSCSYVCTKKMYEEGGYEPTTTCLDPEIEERLKAVIKALLD